MASITPGLTALTAFRPAPAALLDARRLQQRVDRKYLLSASRLEALLEHLQRGYCLALAAGHPSATYDTRYFDTADRLMYEAHRRGRRPRYKVRIRRHHERRLSFLEVKRKGADERTQKARLERRVDDWTLDEEASTFVAHHAPVPPSRLSPQLRVTFQRLTLVGENVDERLTLDWDLALALDGREVSLPAILIAEVKQARYGNGSPSIRALRALHVRERAISKFCLGTALLAPVRTHPFTPGLRVVERLTT